MCQTYVGDDTYGRLDYLPELAHLILLGYTCLEDTNLRLFVQKPYRQRHTYL